MLFSLSFYVANLPVVFKNKVAKNKHLSVWNVIPSGRDLAKKLYALFPRVHETLITKPLLR